MFVCMLWIKIIKELKNWRIPATVLIPTPPLNAFLINEFFLIRLLINCYCNLIRYASGFTFCCHKKKVDLRYEGNVCYANHLRMQTMKTPIWTTGSRSKGQIVCLHTTVINNVNLYFLKKIQLKFGAFILFYPSKNRF